VAIPVLQVVALTRFFRRRGRWLLVVALLPSTAVICWFVVRTVAAGGDFGWVLLAFLGPASAPLLALTPSVARWVAAGTGSALARP
jgi:NAD/NADP transhydrogenase beta subunit